MDSHIVAAANAKKRMDDFRRGEKLPNRSPPTRPLRVGFQELRDSGLKALPSILEFSLKVEPRGSETKTRSIEIRRG